MARGAKARLFAAVDPPAAVREQLAGWAREVSGVLRGHGDLLPGAGAPRIRLLAPDTMHVTLCFLGSRPVDELEALAAALGECSAVAGELTVGAPLWLPPRNPRSLALEIGDRDGRLERLQRTLVAAFARAVEWEPERRRFRAHLTVARIGRSRAGGRRRRERAARGPRRGRPEAQGPAPDAPADPAQAPLPPTPQLSFTPSAVVLYRSWLRPEGASYEALATRALATSSSSSSSASASSAGDAGAGAP